MKKLLAVALGFGFCVTASAQVPVPPAATAAEAAAGTDRYKYLTPYALAQAGISGGSGGVVSNVWNTTPAFATYYTNNTPYWLNFRARLNFVPTSGAQSRVTIGIDTNLDNTVDVVREYHMLYNSSAATVSGLINEEFPPYSRYSFTNNSGGGAMSFVATAGDLIYSATNGATVYATSAGSAATATNSVYLLNDELSTNGFLSGDFQRARMPVPQRAWGTWNDFPDGYPPLGPDNDVSWATSTNVNEAYCIAQADWFRTNGMLAAGWKDLIVEEGWHTGLDSNGRYVTDTVKFPNGMAYLANYWKSKGFTPGIYMAVQPIGGGTTCEGYAATSYTNLDNHFKQTSDWGYEFYFIDACGAYDQFWRGSGLPGAPTTLEQEINQRERLINNAIARTRKNIGWLSVGTQNGATESGQFSPFSFSQHSVYFPHPGGPSAMGRWDFLVDDFQAIIDREHTNGLNGWTAYTYPGHYFYAGQLNDNGPFTTNTYQMAFSLQCLNARAMYINSQANRRYSVGDSNLAVYLGPVANPPSTWYTAPRDRLLTNQEIAAVHLDPAVIPGRRIWSNSLAEIWWRPVGANAASLNQSDEHAVVVINRSTTNKTIDVPWSLFARPGLMRVRDLINLRNLGDYTNAYTLTIQPTNSAFLRLTRLPTYMVQEEEVGFQEVEVNGTGVSKTTLAAFGPSPFFNTDGLAQTAANGSIAKVIRSVPYWATNCTVRYLGYSAFAGVVAWSNTFVLTITHPTGRQLLDSGSYSGITNTHYQTVNGTATWSTNYFGFPLTNAPKTMELHLSISTNASARYILGPLLIKFEGHKQF